MRKKPSKIYIVVIIILFLVLAMLAGAMAVNHYYPMTYSDIIFQNAKEFDLEPELIFAVIHAESRFRANARSPVGASGLMQIMEDTANWIAPMAGLDDFVYSEQIFDPEINIRLGSFYIRMMLDRFDDQRVALCAYNAGSGNVSSWLTNPDYSSDGVTLNYIPFTETRNYIERVERNIEIYRLLLSVTSVFR